MDDCESQEEPLKDTTALKNGADDADDHNLRDTSQGSNFAGNATDSDPEELGKEAGI